MTYFKSILIYTTQMQWRDEEINTFRVFKSWIFSKNKKKEEA